MNCRADYQGHTRVTFAERHTHLIPFCLPRSQCIVYSHKPKPKLVEPMSESTWVINPDFFPCPFLYAVVVITIIQLRGALSVKGLMFFSIHLLAALKSFFRHILSGLSVFFFPVSENACGLKLFKCSLLRTSCLITYLLDLLSHIFFLKDKLKEKCWLSSSQRRLRDLKELKKTLVLINNSHVIACILVKSLEDTEVLTALTFLKALDSMVWKRIPQSTGRNENALR